MDVQYWEVLLDQPLKLNGGHWSANPENQEMGLPGTEARFSARALQAEIYSPIATAA